MWGEIRVASGVWGEEAEKIKIWEMRRGIFSMG